MAFVDGENLTLQAEKFKNLDPSPLLVEIDFDYRRGKGPYYRSNCCVWFPPAGDHYRDRFEGDRLPAEWTPWDLDRRSTGSHYYTSVVGTSDAVKATEDILAGIMFNPVVFKKPKGTESTKIVDITIAKDMLLHCYQDNYDVAILVSADADFVPVIEAVKRMGKRVCVASFRDALGNSGDLRRAASHYEDITGPFKSSWIQAVASANRRRSS
jgi:hypothetical protein